MSEAEKQYLIKRKEAGISLRQIACELGYSWETTRKWWRYYRDQRQPRPRGRPAVGILSSYPAEIREQAIAIKQEHPYWGPANVKLELRERQLLIDTKMPSDARLSALFKAECPHVVQPREKRTYAEKVPTGITRPHQRWQIDTKENVPLGEKDVASILEVRDPRGALMIASQAFMTTTEKRWRKLSLAETQNTLRQAFEQWGLPLEIQTDREVVYVGSSDRNFPSPFTLWLIGLGIRHVVSRSYHPTDQAHVERNHRTLGDMAWKGQSFEALEQLQQALDDGRQRYNECLAVKAADCQSRPPLDVHPWARFSGRPFHRSLEWETFDMHQVDQYLSERVWTRQITETGVAVLGNHRYYVGRKFAGKKVSVRFILETRNFRFETHDGQFIRDLQAVGFDREDLIGYLPASLPLPVPFQLPLPFKGV
jgi:transposase-like protein